MKIVDSPTGGLRGEGSVQVVNDTQVGITIKEKDGKQHHLTLEYPQGVKLVQIGNWQLQDVDDVFIQLTQDKSDIKFIRPRNGTFYTQFARFGAEEGELPTILYSEMGKPFAGAKWDNPARYRYYVLYEIFAAAQYSGMEILDVLTYEFEYDENIEDWVIVGSERKKWHTHNLTYLNVFGFDAQHDSFAFEGKTFDAGGPELIAFVLPELEEILQQRDRVGQVTVKDGWVTPELIIPGPFGMTKEALETAAAGAQAANEAERNAISGEQANVQIADAAADVGQD
jgi:hypothetical protein